MHKSNSSSNWSCASKWLDLHCRSEPDSSNVLSSPDLHWSASREAASLACPEWQWTDVK